MSILVKKKRGCITPFIGSEKGVFCVSNCEGDSPKTVLPFRKPTLEPKGENGILRGLRGATIYPSGSGDSVDLGKDKTGVLTTFEKTMCFPLQEHHRRNGRSMGKRKPQPVYQNSQVLRQKVNE